MLANMATARVFYYYNYNGRCAIIGNRLLNLYGDVLWNTY